MITNLIKDAMDDYWGERCPDYHGGCICCQAWEQYDILTEAKASQQITDSLEGEDTC